MCTKEVPPPFRPTSFTPRPPNTLTMPRFLPVDLPPTPGVYCFMCSEWRELVGIPETTTGSTLPTFFRTWRMGVALGNHRDLFSCGSKLDSTNLNTTQVDCVWCCGCFG